MRAAHDSASRAESKPLGTKGRDVIRLAPLVPRRLNGSHPSARLTVGSHINSAMLLVPSPGSKSGALCTTFKVLSARCQVRRPPTRLESHRIKGQACAPKAEVCLITVYAIDPFASVQSRWLSVPPTIRTATLRRRLPDDASEQFCSAGLHRVIRQRVGNRRARFGVKILTPHVLRLTIAFVTVCS